eukprot:jgi/Mesen1/6037/ME000308S05231
MAEKAPADVESWFSKVSSQVQDSLAYFKPGKAAENTATVSKKLLWSTGKAAWIAGTTFLILVVPLIIEMDREAQITELESQQGLLGAAPPQSL